MTVIRIARCFAVALALGMVVAAPAASQDTLTRAKELYAGASYEEALTILDHLTLDAAATDAAEVGVYRAYCLLALGRTDEGRRAIEALVRLNPLIRTSEEQMSPRLLTVFRDVKRQLLPQIVRQSYEHAKAAYDQKEWLAATTEFDRVLLLLDDPDSTSTSSSGDLRMLATGFRDLSKMAATPTASPTTAPSSAGPANAAAASSPAVTTDVTEPRRIFGAGDKDVSAPVVVSQTLPPWRPSRQAGAPREYQGAVAVVIDQNGNVESVSLVGGAELEYNAVLVKAARAWKFQPAMKDGAPVRYRKLVGIHLLPPT